MSKVANFSIDLKPAVQVSGTLAHARKRRNGSAGIRNKERWRAFTRWPRQPAEYAAHRQRFLAEQGLRLHHPGDADLLARELGEQSPRHAERGGFCVCSRSA